MGSNKLVPKFLSGTTSGGTVTGNNIGIGGGLNPTSMSPKSINPWSAVGTAADIVSGFVPDNTAYLGTKGLITQSMDKTYDKIADTAMGIPPWGTIAGGAMKVAGLLNKGMSHLGAGTDGMTTADAILGSNFLGPIGWINGWTGKKADTMEKDISTWSLTGNSYTGSNITVDDAMTKQGKKYGGFSRGAMRKANDLIHAAGRTLNIISNIMQSNAMANETLANLLDMNNAAYMSSMSGGYDQGAIHSARKGGILSDIEAYRRAHRISFLMMKLNPYQEIETEDIEKFLNGGLLSVIPEGALHAHKHHIEDVREDLTGEITHKGIPVIDNDGNLTAEIERNEIIFSKSITDLIEELRKLYHEETSPSKKTEIARQAGEMLSNEICENTDDRTGLIEQVLD